MSRKVAAFTSIITRPLPLYNFEVRIKGVEQAIIVESTTFPTEKLRIIELWHNGEKIRYPGIPENDGTWKVKIPDSDSGVIRAAFEKIKSSMYNQKSGVLIPTVWADAQVIARDLEDKPIFSVILHGTWLRGRDQVDMANNDPAQSWKWDYEFVYQWIEDKEDKKQPSPDPMNY